MSCWPRDALSPAPPCRSVRCRVSNSKQRFHMCECRTHHARSRESRALLHVTWMYQDGGSGADASNATSQRQRRACAELRTRLGDDGASPDRGDATLSCSMSVPAAASHFAVTPQLAPRTSMTGRTTRPTAGPEHKACNCKNSKCLKLYCECFASGRYCSTCNCLNCMNNRDHEAARSKAIETILERNPNAFRPKIQVQQV
jgi:Tesmin/TSO1-like CXC domain, cysteine-rich domain